MVGLRAPVDFVVIGAMKALTTSVLATLSEHPGIAVASRKETEFFVEQTGGRHGLSWYESLFVHALPGQLRGEASPQYTFFPVYSGVPQRMFRAAPDARLVYLLRDPVARTVSQWRHACARGVEHRPLREAVLTDARYLLPSLYWLQLEQYLAHVDPGQLLVVDTDRLVDAPAAGLAALCRHIGADPELAPQSLARLNSGEDHARPTALARRIRRRPGSRGLEAALRVRLPHRLGLRYDAALSEPNPAVTADPELAAELGAVFAGDLARLREHLGAEAPAWTAPGFSGVRVPPTS
jgi:hypothetical protein